MVARNLVRFPRFGAVAWAALVGVSCYSPARLGLLDLLFLLAVWIIVPMGIPLLPRVPLLRRAAVLQPLAASLTTLSFFLPKGLPAACLAGSWMGVNALLLAGGVTALKSTFRGGVSSLLKIAALFLPAIGGINLVASRLGYPLAGFPEPIILLTAIHFHFTGFAAVILAALAVESTPGRRAFLPIAGGLGLLVSTPAIAVGFLHSPLLKSAGVALLSASMIALALAQFMIAKQFRSGSGKFLIGLSSASVTAAMILAAVYEHGFATGRSWLSISQMSWTHGLLNGLGYCLAGLLGWRIEQAGGNEIEAAAGEILPERPFPAIRG